MKSHYIKGVLASALVSFCAFSQAAELKVVTSFSVLNDLVQAVGGEHIQLTNLVGANGDAHVYQPSPRDAQAVSQADLLVVNGLGFEGWMERLEQSSGFKGVKLVATQGVDLIHLEDEDEHHEDEHHEDAHHEEDHHEENHHEEEEAHHHHGEFDPHAWHSVSNVLVYVDNIRRALVQLAPEHATSFNQNAQAYVAKLKKLETSLVHKMQEVPEHKRNVITSHDAFGYLAREYGFHFMAPQGVSTEAEASAADVVKIIKQIRQQHIQAVFVENMSNPKLIEQIARETGAKIGGKLFADALSKTNQGAGTYINMMQHNINTLVNALSQ